MATHAVTPAKSSSHKQALSDEERRAAFIEECVEFARERFAAMSPEEAREAAKRLRALNMAAEKA